MNTIVKKIDNPQDGEPYKLEITYDKKGNKTIKAYWDIDGMQGYSVTYIKYEVSIVDAFLEAFMRVLKKFPRFIKEAYKFAVDKIVWRGKYNE
jgi:hypothetical protein